MTDAAAVAYNPFEPGFAEDPYKQYRAMREHEPVHESPFGIRVLAAFESTCHCGGAFGLAERGTVAEPMSRSWFR